ncbi:site-specific integrase [Actinomadura sp. NPDC048032]|uniref:site-specific integrase n=1 Tax=Actinomadura sp. NPDC048032 TaxID=3155747 RepID=UPI0033F37D12
MDEDPHISANWFRTRCWHPARAAADLGCSPRIHDLRHAHASWLLAGGADLQVVKERLGHRKISTTERYLPPHRRRNRPRSPTRRSPSQDHPTTGDPRRPDDRPAHRNKTKPALHVARLRMDPGAEEST